MAEHIAFATNIEHPDSKEVEASQLLQAALDYEAATEPEAIDAERVTEIQLWTHMALVEPKIRWGVFFSVVKVSAGTQVLKGFQGLRRFRKALEGFRRFWKVFDGLERFFFSKFWKVSKGFGRFLKV